MRISDVIPGLIKPHVLRGWRHLHPHRWTDEEIHELFIAEWFNSREEYRNYRQAFNESRARDIIRRAVTEYEQPSGRSQTSLGDVGLEVGARYYALLRAQQPEMIVETGVCNGVSTLCILLALADNDRGRLFSIDYPMHTDDSLDEFRQKTFADYGGAAIPAGKESGWLIPDEYQDRWELTVGKSQRELPRVLERIDDIDVFFHDSEHSAPCMMFEYELAWEHLRDGGLLVSDDINWNDAFDTFEAVRADRSGLVTRGVGYMAKSAGEN